MTGMATCRKNYIQDKNDDNERKQTTVWTRLLLKAGSILLNGHTMEACNEGYSYGLRNNGEIILEFAVAISMTMCNYMAKQEKSAYCTGSVELQMQIRI